MFLVFLVFFLVLFPTQDVSFLCCWKEQGMSLLVVLVRQHIRTNSAGHHASKGAQCTTAHLVAYKCASSASQKGRTEAALAFSRPAGPAGPTGSTGASRRTGLWVLALGRGIAMVAVALLLRRGIVLLLSRRRVGGMAAIRIVTLVIFAGRRTVVLLWGRIGRLRGRRVWALWAH